MLPFTTEDFLGVFARYNEAIWPVHIAAWLLGLIAVTAVLRPRPAGDRIVLGLLGLFWLWNGTAYHWWQLSAITPAAWLFGAAFIVQSALFLRQAASGRRLGFRFGGEPRRLAGAAFIAYAAVVYSLIGPTFGHSWPQAPYFGVAPCPTVIFTIGLLLLADRERVAPGFALIPLAWSLVGGSAAFLLGVPEDYGLLLAGLLGTFLLLRGRAGKERNNAVATCAQ